MRRLLHACEVRSSRLQGTTNRQLHSYSVGATSNPTSAPGCRSSQRPA
jgi:hypothetical protein